MPYTHSEAEMKRILGEIEDSRANGRSLAAACKKAGLPSPNNYYRWKEKLAKGEKKGRAKQPVRPLPGGLSETTSGVGRDDLLQDQILDNDVVCGALLERIEARVHRLREEIDARSRAIDRLEDFRRVLSGERSQGASK